MFVQLISGDSQAKVPNGDCCIWRLLQLPNGNQSLVFTDHPLTMVVEGIVDCSLWIKRRLSYKLDSKISNNEKQVGTAALIVRV